MPTLGDLEHAVMDVLWNLARPLTVREVHAELAKGRDLAYTTVMTVLDRLSKKHLVTRELEGRAWKYRPGRSREQLVADEMVDLLAGTADQRRASLTEFARRLDAADRRLLASALGN